MKERLILFCRPTHLVLSATEPLIQTKLILLNPVARLGWHAGEELHANHQLHSPLGRLPCLPSLHPRFFRDFVGGPLRVPGLKIPVFPRAHFKHIPQFPAHAAALEGHGVIPESSPSSWGPFEGDPGRLVSQRRPPEGIQPK